MEYKKLVINSRCGCMNIEEFIKQYFNNDRKAYYLFLKKELVIKIYNNIIDRYQETYCYGITNNGKDILLPPKFSLKFMNKNVKVLINQPYKINNNNKEIGNNNKFYSHQIEIINHLYNKYYNIKDLNSSCIFVQEPGLGKTIIGIGLIQKLWTKTLIIVPSNTIILNDWIRTLQSFLPQLRIGSHYSKNKSNFNDYDIIVTIVNTFVLKPILGYSFLIVDECHLFLTRIRFNIFQKLQPRYTLGLSASMSIVNNPKLLRLDMQIGPIVESNEIIDDDSINWITKVFIINYLNSKNQIYYNKQGLMDIQKMIQQLINDDKRNNLIINEAFKLYNDNNNHIYVITDRRDHVQTIYDLLQKKIDDIIIAPEIVNILIGKVVLNEEIIAKSRIIVCTYAYCSIGISIKNMNAMIFATPRRNNLKQIMGRCYRRNCDNTKIERKFIDIVDTLLIHQHKTRLIEYKRRGAQIIDNNI